MENWIKQLEPIIIEYREGTAIQPERNVNEPLDGDEVEDLIRIIRDKINFHEGNITQEDCGSSKCS